MDEGTGKQTQWPWPRELQVLGSTQGEQRHSASWLPALVPIRCCCQDVSSVQAFFIPGHRGTATRAWRGRVCRVQQGQELSTAGHFPRSRHGYTFGLQEHACDLSPCSGWALRWECHQKPGQHCLVELLLAEAEQCGTTCRERQGPLGSAPRLPSSSVAPWARAASSCLRGSACWGWRLLGPRPLTHRAPAPSAHRQVGASLP